MKVPAEAKTKQQVSVQFVENHSEGLEIAAREKKPVLLFFTISENNSSQRMLEAAFCNEEIIQLAKHFVCIKVDGVLETSVCKTLGIKGFPTIVLTNSSGNEIQRLTGKPSAEQLAVQMHVVLQTVAMRRSSVM
ncbi:hypothetical protein FACS189419_02530 [Planctomycetales bacterium]|nr:hypothetical protein FACS189419_02530 [Planctomycetales bacterium]